jgi:SAM-dependent methyltransferase
MAGKPVSDTWERGNPYEQYVGRWSRRIAAPFLSWLNTPPGLRWVDVGCGTGALCAAIADLCAPASVIGVEPSEGFLQMAKSHLGEQVSFYPGSATAIPLPDAAADVVVSGLVLNFVQDPPAAMAEFSRVCGKAGIVAAYVWDYAGKMELMRHFWDAAVRTNPDAAKLDEGPRFPLCHPDALGKLFDQARLQGVEVRAIDVPTPFQNFDDYWQPFLGGQGPAPAYAMSLDEPARARLREGLKAALPIQADGSIMLTARAWAVRGTVAKT